MAEPDILVREVGPREGFQIEPAGIPTDRKIALIEALSDTGLREIEAVSFASPKAIPQFADAAAVLDGLRPEPDVAYTAIWFNERGLERALAARALTMRGIIAVSASDAFAMKNWRYPNGCLTDLNEPLLDRYVSLELPVWVNAAAAFGCNFQGRVPTDDLLRVIDVAVKSVADRDLRLGGITLADTMGWANPHSVRSLVDTVAKRFADVPLALHLHDTRGLGMANALAGLEAGITILDSSIAGLGGCPFSGAKGSSGNIATEDLVLLLHEMGYTTGVDSAKILRAAALAEQIVGHPADGKSLRGGHLADTGLIRAAT